MTTYKTIADLAPAVSAAAVDLLEASQAGTSKSITLDQVATVVAGSSQVAGAFLPLAGGTLSGDLHVGDHFTLGGSGNATARLAITGQFTDGAAPPLLDLIDLNMSGATPSTGFDIRFFGRDTNDAIVLGAVINGGMATRTAGSFKGDIDFLVYGAGFVVQAGVALSGVYGGFVPITNNLYQLGDSTLRWSVVNSVLGNFSGNMRTATLTVGSTLSAEAVDITGNIFLRTGGSIIYSGGAISFQSGASQPLTFVAGAGAAAMRLSATGLLQFMETGAAAPALKPTVAFPPALSVRTATDSADIKLQALTFSSSSATPILASRTTITGGSTANVPTLTTGPVTGNPTKWLPYDDNGTTRYIPSW